MVSNGYLSRQNSIFTFSQQQLIQNHREQFNDGPADYQRLVLHLMVRIVKHVVRLITLVIVTTIQVTIIRSNSNRDHYQLE